MNKQDLLQLEKLASLTPKEIEKQQPAVFTKLTVSASDSFKTTVENRLKDAPAVIKDSLARIRFDHATLGKLDVKTVLSKNVLSGTLSAEKKKEIEKAVAKIPPLGKLDDIIQPDTPLMINPSFQPDLMKAKVYRLSDVASLPQEKIDKALGKDLSLNTISNDKLDELVKANILTAKEASNLGLASNLYSLFDSSFELTEHVKSNGAVNSMEDLIGLERADWQKLVKDSKVELPKDLKPDDYAEILYKKVENLFPGETLVSRISKVKASELSRGLEGLKLLSDKNEKVFGKSTFEELSTEGLSAAEIKKVKDQYEALDRIVKVNPGLKVNEILNDRTLTNAEKGKRVTERIGLLDKFTKNNPDVNYLARANASLF